MRLFLAIPADAKLRAALCGIQDELRRRGVRGNYSHPENLHLTLAFIGEYPDPDAVLEAIAPLRFAPFRLELCRLGAFEGTWWAGLAESESLTALAAQLRRLLASAGIPYDRKRFKPHITLIRQPSCTRDPELGTVPVPRAATRAERVSLMLSTRGKHGVIYSELGALAARKEEP